MYLSTSNLILIHQIHNFLLSNTYLLSLTLALRHSNVFSLEGATVANPVFSMNQFKIFFFLIESEISFLSQILVLGLYYISSSNVHLDVTIYAWVSWQVRRYMGDMVKVYSITVTNALDGVASSCRACALVPENSKRAGSSCVPCPAGFFINRDANRCQECPANTHLAGRHTYGQDACVACGPGSISNKVETPQSANGTKWHLFNSSLRKNNVIFQEHSRCYSDCSFTHTANNRTLTFDLSALSDVASLTIGPSFTSKGTKYFHLFNITLCGHEVTHSSIYYIQKHA